MNKTFGEANLKDKIYRVVVHNSSIIENIDGEIIKEMTIEAIEPTGGFYDLMLRLSDGSSIRVCRNNEVASIERSPCDKMKHPMAVFEDFYSQNKRKLLNNVIGRLSENAERMNELKTEALKISNTCIMALNIAKTTMMACENEEEEKVVTEEEFASMAL